MNTLSNTLIGIAGVHFVVSELTLRNLVALPTVRNTAGYDIIVGTPDGTKHAFLQVKTSLKRVKFWPVSAPDKCVVGSNIFYVFLRYTKNQGQRFEAFLESSQRVITQVQDNLRQYRRQGKKEFAYWALPANEEEVNKLKVNWEFWKPPAS